MTPTPPDDIRSTLPEIPSPPHNPELHEQQLHDQPAPGGPQHFQPPRKKSLTPWVAVLPLILLGGALWQSDKPDGSLDNMSLSDNAIQTRPRPKATATPTPQPQEQKFTYTLFVPNGDGHLQRKTITVQKTPPSTIHTNFEMESGRTLSLLLQKSPRSFPPGARMLGVPQLDETGTVRVNWNRQFTNPKFWQGETRTDEAIYAIVNTLAAVPIEKANTVCGVQFLIEGKPIQSLGEVDTSDAIEPDMSLVAKP